MARRTKAEADETRTKLLDAAEEVFFEKGVSRTSLGDIALRAGGDAWCCVLALQGQGRRFFVHAGAHLHAF